MGLPQVRQCAVQGCSASGVRLRKGARQVRQIFFSLSISDLQKEEIKRNQKKSVSGGGKIKSLNFANDNDNENDNCHPEGKSTSTLTSTF